MKKSKTSVRNGGGSAKKAPNVTEAGRLRDLVRDLKRDLRKERSAKRDLAAECAEYRKALLNQFMKSCKEEEWRNLHEEDVKYSMADILTEWKLEQGK